MKPVPPVKRIRTVVLPGAVVDRVFDGRPSCTIVGRARWKGRPRRFCNVEEDTCDPLRRAEGHSLRTHVSQYLAGGHAGVGGPGRGRSVVLLVRPGRRVPGDHDAGARLLVARGLSGAGDGAHRLHHLLRVHADHRALSVRRRRIRGGDQAPRPQVRRGERLGAAGGLHLDHHHVDRRRRRRHFLSHSARMVRPGRHAHRAGRHRHLARSGAAACSSSSTSAA
jgi:hypothetical protein